MKYLLLDFRPDNLEDTEIVLCGKQKEEIEKEIEYLKSHNWEIVNIDLDFGCVVVRDQAINLPRLKLNPWIYTSSVRGHICQCCNSACDEWFSCMAGEIAEKKVEKKLEEIEKEYQKRILEAKIKFFNAVFK